MHLAKLHSSVPLKLRHAPPRAPSATPGPTPALVAPTRPTHSAPLAVDDPHRLARRGQRRPTPARVDGKRLDLTRNRPKQTRPTRPWWACKVHRRAVEARNARCRQLRAREASGGLGRRAARSGRRRRALTRATRREGKLGPRHGLNTLAAGAAAEVIARRATQMKIRR